MATALYLNQHYAGKPVYLVGTQAFRRELLSYGIPLVDDGAVAVNAGAQSVLVMSGETDEAILKASDVQPKYVLRDVAELAQILRGGATA